MFLTRGWATTVLLPVTWRSSMAYVLQSSLNRLSGKKVPYVSWFRLQMISTAKSNFTKSAQATANTGSNALWYLKVREQNFLLISAYNLCFRLVPYDLHMFMMFRCVRHRAPRCLSLFVSLATQTSTVRHNHTTDWQNPKSAETAGSSSALTCDELMSSISIHLGF